MKPERLWPLAITLVLVVTVLGNIVVFQIANERHANIVAPDYYHRAVTWDSTLAVQKKSDALGWSFDAVTGPVAGNGKAILVAHLSDRDGQPVRGARITVHAVSNVDADSIVRATLAPSAVAGVYAAPMPLRHGGLWELRFDAARGEDLFVATVHKDVAQSTPHADHPASP